MNGIVTPGTRLNLPAVLPKNTVVRFASETAPPTDTSTGDQPQVSTQAPAKKSGSLLKGLLLALAAYKAAGYATDSKSVRYAAGAAGFFTGYVGVDTAYSFASSLVKSIIKTVKGGGDVPPNTPVISKPDAPTPEN